jgi:hypothetical protein
MHDAWKRVKMDVSRSKESRGPQATAEREPSPRWSAAIESAEEVTHAAVPRPVIRINAARLIVAVSVVALMTMLLADPTRVPNGAVPPGEGGTTVSGAGTVPVAPVTPVAALSPRLVVDAQPLGKRDEMPLGVSVVGPSEGAVLELTGLPSGWKLSSGRPFGADGWRLPVADLADAVIWPLQDFVGTIDVAVELRLADDTLADRQTVRREWAQRDGPPKETVEPSDRLLANDPTELADLCRRGEELLSAGDIAAARLLLERAARAGSPRAAFMLGTSYDPKVLKYLGVRGVPADVTLARNWYEKAKEHGYGKAPRLIGSFTSDEGKPVAPINNQGGRPTAE